MCQAAGMDFWPMLKRAEKGRDKDGFHYLLVGAPIPKKVGKAPTEVHWQAIALAAGQALFREQLRGFRPHSPEADKVFIGRLRERRIPWVESTNVGGTRLYARGSAKLARRKKSICLLGCGAVGSVVAECLARAGYEHIILVDNDSLEIQNLSRHALPGHSVGFGKASALAHHLSGMYPAAKIDHHPLPLPSGLEGSPKLKQAVDAADVILDCSADEAAFYWGSSYANRARKLLVQMHINAGATMLTIFRSGRRAPSAEVAGRFLEEMRAGKTPFQERDYDTQLPEVGVEAGCWKGTFPARGCDISALVSATMHILEKIMTEGLKGAGAVYVAKRNETRMSPSSLIELAFAKQYS